MPIFILYYINLFLFVFQIQVSLELAREEKIAWQETVTYNTADFQDYELKRKFEKYSLLGSSALPDDKFELLKKAISEMENNYARAKICDFFEPTKCDLSLEPGKLRTSLAIHNMTKGLIIKNYEKGFIMLLSPLHVEFL